jgi:4,5-dihydroxyphthalate decarboxylase
MPNVVGKGGEHGKVDITIATWDYDRVRPIMDGRVGVEGCEVNFIKVEPEECFHRAWYHQDFDVTEIGLSGYIIATSRGTGVGGVSPYIGIPVYLSRSFRCSGIYVRSDRGIGRPQDLKGIKVGVPEYQIAAAVWSRGFLSDEYGVRVEDVVWMQGDMDNPGRKDQWPNNLPVGFPLHHLKPGETIYGLRAASELDAFIGPRTPRCYRDGKTPLVRLFEDFETVEKSYYRKTGIFPIMHLVGVRRELYEKHPWIAPTSIRRSLGRRRSVRRRCSRRRR